MEAIKAHGASIPAIGFGTWPMKGEVCIQAVGEALAAGYRHIDTAAGYQNESEVGEAIRNSGIDREEIFVTTKITPWDLGEDDMQRAAAESLERLGLAQLDLVLIHWPSRTLAVEDTIRSLNGIKNRGLAYHIGVSNFTTRLLDRAWEATEQPLAALQCEYHPFLNQDKLLAAAWARGMAFTAYSPLGQGDVSQNSTVTAIAERLRRTPAQVVLRWLIQQGGIAAIPKSASPARIRENICVFDFDLEPDDMAAIGALARPDGRLVRDPDLAPEWDD